MSNWDVFKALLLTLAILGVPSDLGVASGELRRCNSGRPADWRFV